MKKEIINIRVSEDEKTTFKKQAILRGFDTISQYIRHLIKNDKK